MIDKQSGIPIYIQIQSEIKKKMEDGVWKVGTSIPAERQLAEMFHVSRMTVRQAIQGLVDDNILQRRVGAGTFIAEKKLTERLEAVTSFTNLMLQEESSFDANRIVWHSSGKYARTRSVATARKQQCNEN